MSKNTGSLPPVRRWTLEVAVGAFLDHERLAGRSNATLYAHANAFRQFRKHWGDRDLREATQEDLEVYARGVHSRVSRETAYLYLAAVRALFRYLVGSQELLVDPARDLPMPRMSDRPIGKVFSVGEMMRLLEFPDLAATTGLRDRALLELLYSTGLRVSEARRVRVQDLVEDGITVRDGKGAKDRVVPVGKRAIEWIRRYLAEGRPKSEAPEIFLNLHGRAFGDMHFRVVVRHLGKKAGLNHLTCHAIRRSMATHLLQAGANPKEVSAILGHEDLRSLSRYIKTVIRDVKETHRKTHPREEP